MPLPATPPRPGPAAVSVEQAQTTAPGKGPDLVDRGIDAVGRGVARLGKAVGRALGRTREIDPAHRRDGLGVALLVLAVVSAAGIWFGAGGPVGRGISAGIGYVVGRGAVVLPVLLAIAGVVLMATEPRPDTRPRVARRRVPAGPGRAGAGAPRRPPARRARALAHRRRRDRLRRGHPAGHRAHRVGRGAGARAAGGLRAAAAHGHARAGGAGPRAAAARPRARRRRTRPTRTAPTSRRRRPSPRPSPSRCAARRGAARLPSPTSTARPSPTPTPDAPTSRRAAAPRRPKIAVPEPAAGARARGRGGGAAAALGAAHRGRRGLPAAAQRHPAHRPGAEAPQRRQRRDDRGDHRRARPVLGRRPGHRLHPRPDGHALRDRARPGRQGREDHPAHQEHLLRGGHRQRADPRADPGQVRGRHRGAQHRPGDGAPRRRAAQRHRPRRAAPDGDRARQGHRGPLPVRQPGQDAAPAGRGLHGLRQVELRQLDARLAAVAGHARRGPDDPHRPQDGRAHPVRGHPAPDHAHHHRAEEGRRRADLAGRGDGAALPGHAGQQGPPRRRLQPQGPRRARSPRRRAASGSTGPTRTSCASSTSWPTS